VKRAWAFPGAAAACLLVACVAPAIRPGTPRVPAVGLPRPAEPAPHAAEPAPIAAEVRPSDGQADAAQLVITVRWPPRERAVASIPPGTERVAFTLIGNGSAGVTIPQIERPPNGSVSSKTVVVEVPWRQDLDLRLRATAWGTAQIVAQSLWTPLTLKRNARVDAQIELFPATGTESASARFLFPLVTGVFPERGYPSSEIVISGRNFGYGKGPGSWVAFGGAIAGEPALWTDTGQTATIRIAVPPAATSGPVVVRLGEDSATMSSSWQPTPSPGDPWSGRFTVLGPDGDAVTFDNGSLGAIANYRLAYDKLRDKWWVAFTRRVTLANGSAGHHLAVSAVATPSLLPAPGFPRVVAAAADSGGIAGVQLGGLVADPSLDQVFVLWQEGAGAATAVRFGRVTPFQTVLQADPVSATSAGTAFPALAVNDSRTMMATWIDTRDVDSQGRAHPRIYSRTISIPLSGDATFSAPARPVQDTNTPTDLTLRAVGAPQIASDGTDFLVAWFETAGDAMSLMFQQMRANGGAVVGSNTSKADTSRSLEEPHLYWSGKDQKYLAVYANRQGNIFGKASDIYLERRTRLGIVYGEEVQVADNERTLEGRKQCPGSPCGQGSRTQPLVMGNGRDLILVWQFDRDDGEVDILGARMQVNAGDQLARAPEEAGKMAEILFSSRICCGGLGGKQTSPRLSWGKDALLVGWLDSGALYLRGWR